MASGKMCGKKLVVFLGSVRDGRNVSRVCKLVSSILNSSTDFEVTVIDPLEMNVPTLKQPLHFMRDQSTAPTWMLETNDVIKNADALLVISSEYNCSIPPALSNVMDYFPPASYRHKPCGIICYSMGNAGGVRAAALMRPFLSELGTVPIPAQAAIPLVHENISETGEATDGKWKTMVERVITELDWYSDALKIQKAARNPPT